MVPCGVLCWGVASPPPVKGDAMCWPQKGVALTNEDPCKGLDGSGICMGEAHGRVGGVAKAT